MREELKLEPCPFCGGVDLKTYRNLVECQNRDCGVCGPDMGMLGMSEEGARQVAATAWNTRAKPPQPADDNHKALVEALTRKLVIFQNFVAHPGHHPEDRSSEAKDPPSYRRGWIDAVLAMHDRVNAPFTKETDHGEE